MVAVATHDTASAVAGTPLAPGIAFISSGTWSLVGVELPAPRIDAAAEAANFTNEAGCEGTTRFLKNVPGLWILEECRRSLRVEYHAWTEHLAEAPALAAFLLPDDPLAARFFEVMNLERGLVLAAGALAGGVTLLLAAVNEWRLVDFGALDYGRTMRLVVPGVTLTALGFQTVVSSFFVSILGMRRL